MKSLRGVQELDFIELRKHKSSNHGSGQSKNFPDWAELRFLLPGA